MSERMAAYSAWMGQLKCQFGPAPLCPFYWMPPRHMLRSNVLYTKIQMLSFCGILTEVDLTDKYASNVSCEGQLIKGRSAFWKILLFFLVSQKIRIHFSGCVLVCVCASCNSITDVSGIRSAFAQRIHFLQDWGLNWNLNPLCGPFLLYHTVCLI